MAISGIRITDHTLTLGSVREQRIDLPLTALIDDSGVPCVIDSDSFSEDSYAKASHKEGAQWAPSSLLLFLMRFDYLREWLLPVLVLI